jgi:hypothetical protein
MVSARGVRGEGFDIVIGLGERRLPLLMFDFVLLNECKWIDGETSV